MYIHFWEDRSSKAQNSTFNTSMTLKRNVRPTNHHFVFLFISPIRFTTLVNVVLLLQGHESRIPVVPTKILGDPDELEKYILFDQAENSGFNSNIDVYRNDNIENHVSLIKHYGILSTVFLNLLCGVF